MAEKVIECRGVVGLKGGLAGGRAELRTCNFESEEGVMAKKRVVNEPERDEDTNRIQPGETKRFECESCGKEFEVTLEPKAKNSPESLTMQPADVGACPFCASLHVEAV
jgi:hypothetical protein